MYKGNIDISAPSKKNAMAKECWLKRTGNGLWQLVRLIIDTPINIPSVLVSFGCDKNNVEVMELMDERNSKYKKLVEIGNAYTSLCILSISLLVVLIITGYGLRCFAENNLWFVVAIAISALPLAITPVYWYKQYCLKEYIRDLDDYIHLIELQSCSNIHPEYMSAIISEYFLRRHTKRAQVTIDLTPHKRKHY